MKLTILKVGTRGDVQPYVALGIGLKKAGFDVRIVTFASFGDFITSYGLEHFPIDGDPEQILRSDEWKSLLVNGINPFIGLKGLADLIKPLLAKFVKDAWDGCQGADMIVYSTMATYAGFFIAEQMGIPSCGAFLHPLTNTQFEPIVYFPDLPVWMPGKKVYNQLTHQVIKELSWQMLRRNLMDIQKNVLQVFFPDFKEPFRLMHQKKQPILYAISPHIINRPPDWHEQILITGYWFLERPERWEAPSQLKGFIESGPAPVCIGFGSMSSDNPEETADIILKALDKTKQRGILISGWGGLKPSDLPDHTLMIDGAPYDWLFPQMAAVVHHAGAGTTSTALRAGIPSIPVPFCTDQPYWARRIEELGVGTKPISRKQLNSEKLADAIHQATSDTAMRKRAQQIGKLVQKEDGVGNAVRFFQEYLM